MKIFNFEKLYYKYSLKKVEEFNNNGKITVAVFCDAFFPSVDGVVTVVDNLVRKLSKVCNVVVFVPKHNGRTQRRDYLVIGVESQYLKSLNYDMATPVLDFHYKRILSKLRVDVIHCHSPFLLGRVALELHESKKIPMVCTFHSQYKKDILKATKSEVLTSLVLKIIMLVFNGSDEVWTMHQASADTLLDYGYMGKIQLVPNGTEYEPQKNVPQRIARFNKKYGLKKDDFVFLFVGRLVLQKNILFIAKVLKILADEGKKFTMFFVGDGPDRQQLEEKIKEYSLGDKVKLVGAISDKKVLSDYYLRANLMLFPSLYDVSSIVQIEAAAHKTPCAFVEGSVTSCTVTHDKNGFIFANDEVIYANEVAKLMTDKETLKRVSESAFKTLYVTWNYIADLVYSKYRKLIKEYEKGAE